MTQLIALYVAGLSFFFTGMSGLSDNLRKMTGQRFRILLSRATDYPLRAGLLGIAVGVVTQSTSVAAFILSGMVATGLLPLSRALIVLGCANIGTAIVAFIAAVDLHLSILFVIGICGMLLAFKLSTRWKPAISSLLSVGLLFFGLDMMKQAFGPLSASHALVAVAHFFDRWPDVAFLLGMFMRGVVNSSAATAAILITINKGGMLGEFPAMLSVAGIGMGAAIATSFLSSSFKGIARQIALYQILTQLTAGAIVAALLLFERITGIPLLMALLRLITPSISGRMACTYLFLNLTVASISILGLKWAPAWLEKMSPPTLEEDISRPMYLHPGSMESPETAPDLVALEQLRVLRVFRDYLQGVRDGSNASIQPLHHGALTLGREIAGFLQSLLHQPIGAVLAIRIIASQRMEETLRALEENLFLFAETLTPCSAEELTSILVESLDLLLMTASDALQSRSPEDIDMLIRMTDDRGGMMERLRGRYSLDQCEDVDRVSMLQFATTLFERNVWLLRQLALRMKEDVRIADA
jgi:phosphate:Na+ symporter